MKQTETGSENAAQNTQLESELVPLVQTAFGPDLSSVVVYGSYAAGRWVSGSSDINVLILLGRCEPAALKAFGDRGRRFLQKNRITPLVLTVAEFSSSADVFPMEYMDIIARHRVLFGADPTEHVQFSPSNLRHQLEHQLRGTMVSLRQLVIAARGRNRLLRAELKTFAGPIAALFRGLLRLTGGSDIPTDPQALANAVNQVLGFTPGPFVQLFSLQAGGNREIDPHALVDQILVRLSELIEIVDRYEAKQ
ncbi:MAG: hypothetical protein EA403_16465 [Spirochaetaceae bacterium]|nr:MAG: hypothetical protein EA403_16465 [Spirochaetaceae bacterium]